MHSARIKIILSLIFIAQFLNACSGPAANGNANQPTVNTNQKTTASDKSEELEMLIKLPFEPEETVFREDPIPAPADGIQSQYSKKLTAVLKYPALEATKLSETLEKASPPLSATVATDSWFPAELIAQSDLSGDDTLKGSSFPAVDYYQAPFTEGTITRIEGTNYFILELYAK